MARLLVPATIDFSAQALANIDTIEFTNVGAQWGTTATFANTQFNGAAILANVVIYGNAGIQRVVVNGGSVDASRWQFRDWGLEDIITLNGGGGNDSIFGSAQKDTINGGVGDDQLFGNGGNDTIDGGVGNDTIVGGGGGDTLIGGAGNDIVKIFAGSEIVAGETIDGGNQAFTTDTIQLHNAGNVFLSNATISGMDVLDFATGTSTVFLRGDQIGGNPNPDNGLTAFMGAVDGASGADRLVVTGSVELGFVSFTNWTTQDTIALNGTSTGDFIGGSQQADVVSGLGGDDQLFGRGGNDVVGGGAGRDQLSGGSGRDTFDFNDKSESPAFVVGVFSADLISDFEDADSALTVLDDIIDMSGIDANEALAGNQAFFLDNGNGVEQASEITFGQRLNARGVAVTVLLAHTNGDGTPDFAIEFDRVITTFGASDFVL